MPVVERSQSAELLTRLLDRATRLADDEQTLAKITAKLADLPLTLYLPGSFLHCSKPPPSPPPLSSSPVAPCYTEISMRSGFL